MTNNILIADILNMNEKELTTLINNEEQLENVSQQILNNKLSEIESDIEIITDIINKSTKRLGHYKEKGNEGKISKHTRIIGEASNNLKLLNQYMAKLTQIDVAIDDNELSEATDMGGGKIKTKRRRKKRRKPRRKTKRRRKSRRKPRRKTKRRRKSKKSKRRRR